MGEGAGGPTQPDTTRVKPSISLNAVTTPLHDMAAWSRTAADQTSFCRWNSTMRWGPVAFIADPYPGEQYFGTSAYEADSCLGTNSSSTLALYEGLKVRLPYDSTRSHF